MMKKDWEDIKVSRKSSQKVYFESTFLQNISDSIDFLKQEADVVLKELDSDEFKERIEEMDLEEFSEGAIDQIDDVLCDISEFKDEVISGEDVPNFISEPSLNAKVALNMDADYVRRAERKLKRADSVNEHTSRQTVNSRVILLCNKAIEVNRLNPKAYLLKGKALVNLKSYDEAIEEFITCLALDEDNLDVRLEIADANRLNGDFEDAINVYNSVLKVDDGSFEAFRGIALTYYDMEKYADAVKFFEKANSIFTLDDDDKKLWDECFNR
jgi:hypothetical protein